jgi:penicillin-binding protein 1A
LFESEKNPLILKTLKKALIITIITGVLAITLGVLLGSLNDMNKIETLLESKRPALPSILLDRNGQIITKFYSDEKRDIIGLDEIPSFLVQGLIAWEDESFYSHHGFNPLAMVRATIGNMFGRPISGASTLTQQLSRTLFLTRERSIFRKIREMFVSIQLEKKYTKNEILTLYLNHIPFGYGTNGVQTASKYYFNKDVGELTYAEAASLITVISNPTYYSIIKFPKNHKQKQKEVLKKMVKNGIISKVEADTSFNEFWLQYQSTSISSRGAFFNREDQAPYFSDWILNEIERELPTVDVFRDGLTIHSTLDLKANLVAEGLMKDVLEKQQKIFEKEQLKNYNVIQNNYIESVAFLTQIFSLSNVRLGENRNVNRGLTSYSKDVNAGLNLTAQILGINGIDTVTNIMFEKEESSKDLQTQVQGAFIVLENDTGHIVTMIGGKNFDPNNRFNYAMQSRRQPGSAFKPFVYSAALDSHLFNAASIFVDAPYVFTFGTNDPDDEYKPENYGGLYNGKVSMRRALRRSLNIPSCQIFYGVGKGNNYRVPIDRAAALLGLRSQAEINERFKPEISTVLGTGSVSPVEMATGFATFANNGQRRVPNSIIYIEDRDGRTIYEPWKDLQKYYKENEKKLQVISPANAFIITNILKDTVQSADGFLYGAKQRIIASGKEFPPVELAGKTGTTQNWSDAWEVGFSPEITVASWAGFHKYGLSLGYEQAGVNVLGPAFLEYMRQYHIGIKDKLVFKNSGGVYCIQVCKESGLLPSSKCAPEHLYYEYFLPGTVPTEECFVCKNPEYPANKGTEIFMKQYVSKFGGGHYRYKVADRTADEKSALENMESGQENLIIEDATSKSDKKESANKVPVNKESVNKIPENKAPAAVNTEKKIEKKADAPVESSIDTSPKKILDDVNIEKKEEKKEEKKP